MVRTGCDEMRFSAMVTMERLHLAEERHSDLVAALIKAIACYTGGPSAAAAAYEEDLSTDLGMRFVFLDRSSRDLFWLRIAQYCDKVTLAALSMSPICTMEESDGTRRLVSASLTGHPR
jgi:hypothetical protein